MRGFLWATMVLAGLVALGVILQIYFIASYIFGAGTDALDIHEDLGGVVHIVEILVFLTAIPAFWKRWGPMALAFALPVLGTIQIGFSDGDDWVGGIHGLLALFVFGIAGAVNHRARQELGLTARPAT